MLDQKHCVFNKYQESILNKMLHESSLSPQSLLVRDCSSLHEVKM